MIQEATGHEDAAITGSQELMTKPTTRAQRFAVWALGLREGLCDYFGTLGRRRSEPINDLATLRSFLQTRASYLAQTSLYSYLRTRAGMVYPQLFEDDEFVRSVNIAKWHVWLACLSDLSVYAGGLLARHSQALAPQVGALMTRVTSAILDDTGVPADADEQFASHADRVRARLASCEWARVDDDETPFSESPTALIRWAPIVENLKELDEEIVRNSVRFRWQEIRRELRRHLDAEAVLRSAG
jgi:hypothetical protein